jgi:hypothetical protein
VGYKPTFWRPALFPSLEMIPTVSMQTAGVHNVGFKCIIVTADSVEQLKEYGLLSTVVKISH